MVFFLIIHQICSQWIIRLQQLYNLFSQEEVSPVAIDLLKKFLIFNPDKRITIEEALNHPFLAILNSGQ